MSLKVIGAGVGRTGTYSLKLALNRLGFGPTHHMEAVMQNAATQIPLWQQAAEGRFDWPALHAGHESAVDWPTARFFRELAAEHPDARFVLTRRSAESWARSFSQTIYKLLAEADRAPEAQRPWLAMVTEIVAQTGFPLGLDVPALEAAYEAHNAAVAEAIPAERLLVCEVREGWAPLCAFLDVPVPDEPFPRTNDRSEFWDLVDGAW